MMRHVRAALADAEIRRVRGRPIKAELQNAPLQALGIATDATRRKPPS